VTARRDGADAGTRPARPGGRRPHVTGRTAILAVVLCAIALSLAYPIREYIAQRKQIDRLLAQGDQLSTRLKTLESQRRQLNNPVFIERLARDRLHMCLATQMCYVVISPAAKKPAVAGGTAEPWYARLWSSVRQANEPPHSRTAHHGHHYRVVPPGRKTRHG
jgi:cell division protein FtsB